MGHTFKTKQADDIACELKKLDREAALWRDFISNCLTRERDAYSSYGEAMIAILAKQDNPRSRDLIAAISKAKEHAKEPD